MKWEKTRRNNRLISTHELKRSDNGKSILWEQSIGSIVYVLEDNIEYRIKIIDAKSGKLDVVILNEGFNSDVVLRIDRDTLKNGEIKK